MSEIKGIETSEIKGSEIKPHETDGLKDEKPQYGMTVEQAKNYWEEQLDAMLNNKEPKAELDDSAVQSSPKDISYVQDSKLDIAQDTEKRYYDDNGNLYRVGDNLNPNCEYIINGYKYQTDLQGRIISAETTDSGLKLNAPNSQREMKDSMDSVGKGDQNDTDDRGHLIAKRFDGSDLLDNLVPMDANLNRGDFKKMENMLADALDSGAKVEFKVEPIYEGDSYRPSAFKATYTIDGEKSIVVFQNGKEL